MGIARLIPEELKNFIEVYGNRVMNLHLLAVRFKRSVITYKCRVQDTALIEPPDNSILVVKGGNPPLSYKDQNFLLFTVGDFQPGINVPNDSKDSLLSSLFPRGHLLHKFYHSSTLFFVTDVNPYLSIMKKCRKEVAFQSLLCFISARRKRAQLTLAEAASMRHFKFRDTELSQFNRWGAYAAHLCYTSFLDTTFSKPSAYMGKEIYHILKRSDASPHQLPPADFYQCELLLDDTTLGIAYFEKDAVVEYVSPMVVSKFFQSFRDSNSVVCESWLPFYRSAEVWKNNGIKFYIYALNFRKVTLKNILLWLQVRRSEKYMYMYMDLSHVAKILFGDEARFFLKPY